MVTIGVTGHRILAEVDRIEAGLADVVERLNAVFAQPWSVVSGLADGADRVVAQHLLAREGTKLVAVLPLDRDDYETDFATAESKRAFHQMLAGADEVVLIPPRPSRVEAYEACGLAILDRSDVLIAVWDGQGAQGQGGTGAVVAAARRRNLPIAWVHAGNRRPGTEEPTSLGPEQGRVSYERFPEVSATRSDLAAGPTQGRASATAVEESPPVDLLAALSNVFRGVAEDVLGVLGDRARVRRHDDGTILCRQGRFEDTFYVLVEGQANVWVHDVGEPVLVAYLAAGEPIGEIELLMNSPRVADVIASGPVTLLELTHADLEVDQRPELFRALASTAIERLLTVQRQRIYHVAETLRYRRPAGGLFVSYSHEDDLFTKRLVADLKHHQVSVWLDQFDIHPGKSWPRQIGEALDSCEAMIIVMSPASMESGNTEDEWNYYLDNGKIIIPVLHRACRVPFRLNKHEAVVFDGLDYDQALGRLVERARAHLAEVAASEGNEPSG